MTRKVLILTYPGSMALDVVGPADAFTIANAVAGEHAPPGAPPAYDISIVAQTRGAQKMFGAALSLNADRTCDDISDQELDDVDLVVVSGGVAALGIRTDPSMLAFIGRAHSRVRRVASICTGAFLLAEAGLFNNRRATTHWRFAKQLADSYPEVEVVPDKIVCRDGKFWSSGGITSGIDLALTIVEADLGPEMARAAARLMVTHMPRHVGQSQYESPVLQTEAEVGATDLLMREIFNYIRVHPEADLKRATLAKRFNLTEKTISRRFNAFAGKTVGKFVEDARLAHAQIRLENSDESLVEVALRSGFPSPDAMRRAFTRRFSTTPTEFREKFKSATAHFSAPAAE